MNKFDALRKILAAEGFLTSNNPVIVGLKSRRLSQFDGRQILGRYYALVVRIVEFLSIAMYRIPVAEVQQELHRNIGEELGSRTRCIRHRDLFDALVERELLIHLAEPENEADFGRATQLFIGKIRLAMHNGHFWLAAGMIYALEASASPELAVVAEIINLIARREVINLAAIKDRGYVAAMRKDGTIENLEQFIAIHVVDFEAGHESGLRKALSPHIESDEAWKQFIRGYNFVLREMDAWWKGLANAG